MSLLGWAIGLGIANQLMGEANDREEQQRRANTELRRRNDVNERRIARLEDEIRDLKRGSRKW